MRHLIVLTCVVVFGAAKITIDLEAAVKSFYGTLPRDVFLKSPTPWGDLYKTYNWEEIRTILRVSGVRIKRNSFKKTVVLSHDFENPSNLTIKVNAGLSQSVENTITTTWSQSKEFSVAQEFEYDFSVIFAKTSGTTEISFTSTYGKSEERSESVTIGSTSAVEIELKPGQSATAVLTAKKSELEIEVTYVATLRGNVAVNFRKSYKGHHFYGPSVIAVLKSAGLETEIMTYETIKLGTFMEASLKVFDKDTGLPL
ncbi:follicular epithelium yolk protein subunit [Danaus plexippus plexippus]|uniref:Follicular epithelium yolk protein subunit n=1 Tax=Danaus plexippus plexippus TaxID=278856 RepID=A0A212ELC3_DANPL|nr:follicular epithelium yolk protein subunit [Danaus plexippus plexippus]